MREDTRRHERPTPPAMPLGPSVDLGEGRKLLLPQHTRSPRLIIHFHGPGWIAQTAARARFRNSAVLTVQANGASDAYRQAITAPGFTFPELIAAAETAAKTRFPSIVLSSFSAGYGAIREILRDKSNWDRIHAVVLADSMHAAAGQEDPDLGPFVDFARESAAGRKQFLVTHSEVFPGTYMSTTETAAYLLQQLGLKRRPVLAWGPLGMQQLSEAHTRGFHVLGFAGNSAPDHMDHLFALERWYGQLHLPKVRR